LLFEKPCSKVIFFSDMHAPQRASARPAQYRESARNAACVHGVLRGPASIFSATAQSAHSAALARDRVGDELNRRIARSIFGNRQILGAARGAL
jgi:hypothetical protein